MIKRSLRWWQATEAQLKEIREIQASWIIQPADGSGKAFHIRDAANCTTHYVRIAGQSQAEVTEFLSYVHRVRCVARYGLTAPMGGCDSQAMVQEVLSGMPMDALAHLNDPALARSLGTTVARLHSLNPLEVATERQETAPPFGWPCPFKPFLRQHMASAIAGLGWEVSIDDIEASYDATDSIAEYLDEPGERPPPPWNSGSDPTRDVAEAIVLTHGDLTPQSIVYDASSGRHHLVSVELSGPRRAVTDLAHLLSTWCEAALQKGPPLVPATASARIGFAQGYLQGLGTVAGEEEVALLLWLCERELPRTLINRALEMVRQGNGDSAAEMVRSDVPCVLEILKQSSTGGRRPAGEARRCIATQGIYAHMTELGQTFPAHETRK